MMAGRELFAVPAAYTFLEGNCLFRLGRWAEAATRYQAILQVERDHTGAWNNLIQMKVLMKDGAGAKADLEAAEARKVPIQPAIKKQVRSLHVQSRHETDLPGTGSPVTPLRPEAQQPAHVSVHVSRVAHLCRDRLKVSG